MPTVIPTRRSHAGPDTTTAATQAPNRWVRRVALAGIVAPPGFFTIMMVLGLVTPGYDWIARYGSELSLGRLGWIMITNFVALGAVELALAAALGRTIGNRVSGRVATIAIGLVGAAFVVAGVCVTDPATLVHGAHSWHGIVHAFMAVVVFFIAAPIACLATARRMWRHRRFAIYCAVTAVATPLLLIVTFVSGDALGLVERIVIAFVLTWLAFLARELHRGAAAAAGDSAEPRAGIESA